MEKKQTTGNITEQWQKLPLMTLLVLVTQGSLPPNSTPSKRTGMQQSLQESPNFKRFLVLDQKDSRMSEGVLTEAEDNRTLDTI